MSIFVCVFLLDTYFICRLLIYGLEKCLLFLKETWDFSSSLFFTLNRFPERSWEQVFFGEMSFSATTPPLLLSFCSCHHLTVFSSMIFDFLNFTISSSISFLFFPLTVTVSASVVFLTRRYFHIWSLLCCRTILLSLQTFQLQ